MAWGRTNSERGLKWGGVGGGVSFQKHPEIVMGKGKIVCGGMGAEGVYPNL